jgi:hypothetical protein
VTIYATWLARRNPWHPLCDPLDPFRVAIRLDRCVSWDCLLSLGTACRTASRNPLVSRDWSFLHVDCRVSSFHALLRQYQELEQLSPFHDVVGPAMIRAKARLS